MITCPKCKGECAFSTEEITGYITHEMAMDAEDLRYENQPVTSRVDYPCDLCEGTGEISEEKNNDYLAMLAINEIEKDCFDDDIPF